MADYMLLMHNDLVSEEGGTAAWDAYIDGLVASGHLQGGSTIGAGICIRKGGRPARLSGELTGFLRVQAEDLSEARLLVAGNPVYEAGGTVEIRELPPD